MNLLYFEFRFSFQLDLNMVGEGIWKYFFLLFFFFFKWTDLGFYRGLRRHQKTGLRPARVLVAGFLAM